VADKPNERGDIAAGTGAMKKMALLTPCLFSHRTMDIFVQQNGGEPLIEHSGREKGTRNGRQMAPCKKYASASKEISGMPQKSVSFLV
jgi:hypothetical protein